MTKLLYISKPIFVTMKKLLLVLSAAIITVVSCSKQTAPVPIPAETLKSILLGKDTITLSVGTTKQLGFTLNPSDYNVKLLVFSS
jgi:hypothetical protein